MKLLLDTHAFLWFCQGNAALSATAKVLIEDPNNRKLISVASCWEIAIKAALKKLTLGEPSSTYIPAALAPLVLNCCPSPWSMPRRWKSCRRTTKIHLTACWLLKRCSRVAPSSASILSWPHTQSPCFGKSC